MKVLITLQDDKSAQTLVPLMLTYPWPAGSRFKVVHIVRPVNVNSYMAFLPSPLSDELRKERHRQGEKLVRDFALALRDEWRSPFIDELVVEGDAKIELKELIEEWEPDMVIVGSHKKTGIEALGSVSRGIIAYSPASIMIAPV